MIIFFNSFFFFLNATWCDSIKLSPTICLREVFCLYEFKVGNNSTKVDHKYVWLLSSANRNAHYSLWRTLKCLLEFIQNHSTHCLRLTWGVFSNKFNRDKIFKVPLYSRVKRKNAKFISIGIKKPFVRREIMEPQKYSLRMSF